MCKTQEVEDLFWLVERSKEHLEQGATRHTAGVVLTQPLMLWESGLLPPVSAAIAFHDKSGRNGRTRRTPGATTVQLLDCQRVPSIVDDVALGIIFSRCRHHVLDHFTPPSPVYPYRPPLKPSRASCGNVGPCYRCPCRRTVPAFDVIRSDVIIRSDITRM